MPWSNIWEPHGVRTQFSGFVPAEEYVASAQAIFADARFDALRFVIKDLLSIEGHSIDLGALDSIGAIRYGARYTNPNIYLVLLTTDPRLVPFAYPDSKSFLRGLYETRAFPDERVARDWLARQPALTRLGVEAKS